MSGRRPLARPRVGAGRPATAAATGGALAAKTASRGSRGRRRGSGRGWGAAAAASRTRGSAGGGVCSICCPCRLPEARRAGRVGRCRPRRTRRRCGAGGKVVGVVRGPAVAVAPEVAPRGVWVLADVAQQVLDQPGARDRAALVAGVQQPAGGGGRREHGRVAGRVGHRLEPAHGQPRHRPAVPGPPVPFQQLPQLGQVEGSQRDGPPRPRSRQSE